MCVLWGGGGGEGGRGVVRTHILSGLTTPVKWKPMHIIVYSVPSIQFLQSSFVHLFIHLFIRSVLSLFLHWLVLLVSYDCLHSLADLCL